MPRSFTASCDGGACHPEGSRQDYELVWDRIIRGYSEGDKQRLRSPDTDIKQAPEPNFKLRMIEVQLVGGVGKVTPKDTRIIRATHWAWCTQSFPLFTA